MSEVERVLQEAQQLSPRDQLLLVSRLVESVRESYGETTPRRRWREIAGAAPDLMQGTDAQEWVSQQRRRADAERESQWRR